MLDFISTDLIAWDQSTDAIMASGTRTYIISSARNKLRKGFNHVTMQNLKYDIVIQDKLEVKSVFYEFLFLARDKNTQHVQLSPTPKQSPYRFGRYIVW